MTISSRTPEGLPFRCPICGALAVLEPSYPLIDAPCPRCGQLLVWFRDHLGRIVGIDPHMITFETVLRDLGMDSLDIVEVVMELEEETGVSIPEEEVERMLTIGDIIRYLQQQQEEEDAA
jgi:acyl carrier protein